MPLYASMALYVEGAAPHGGVLIYVVSLYSRAVDRAGEEAKGQEHLGCLLRHPKHSASTAEERLKHSQSHHHHAPTITQATASEYT